MQSGLLSANTHFNPMMMTTTRVQPVEDIRLYPEYDRRSPRPTWSLPQSTVGSAARKIPTESDDRDDCHSSDSDRTEEELHSADFSGVPCGTPSEDRGGGGGGGAATAATVTSRPVLKSTVSFGEHVVLVAEEVTKADFQLRNDEDEETKRTGDDGLITIEDGLQKMSLSKSDSIPLNVGRGPNGGRGTKPGPSNETRVHDTGYRRQTPIESWDGGCHDEEDQPMKFYKPNEATVPNNNNDNGTYDCYSQSTVYGTTPFPRMQNHRQLPWYDPPTGYSFPFQIAQGAEQHFGNCQGAAPTQFPPNIQPMWDFGYPTGNLSTSMRHQTESCPIVRHSLTSSLTESNFHSDDLSTTFFQYPSANIDNGNYQTYISDPSSNRPQCAAAPSVAPFHQHPFVSSMHVIPHASLDQRNVRISDTPSAGPPISALSVEPATTRPSPVSDLELALKWVAEQAETRPQSRPPQTIIPPTTDYHLSSSSSPAQFLAPWNEIVPPSDAISLVASSYSDYFPLPSPAQCLPQCNEFTHALSLASSSSSSSCDIHFDRTACASGTPAPSSLCHQRHAYSSGSSLIAASSSSSDLCPSPKSVLSDASEPSVQFRAAAPPSDVRPWVSFSATDAPSPSRVPPASEADLVRGTHSSQSSDRLNTATSVLQFSDHGSVTSSPASVFGSDVTILSADELDDEKMAQIAEAETVAESFEEMALISQDSQGDTPLHVAMIDDKWYLAESLLKRLIRDKLDKQVINVRNKLQQTPLCLAVICNKPQIVETLIEYGADVNVHIKASDDYLGTKFCQPLHLASSRGHLWKQTLKKLLKADNIDLDVFNSDGKSALHCAIEGHGRQFKDVTVDCKDTLRMLAERGANLNQPDCGHEKTPLHYAIERRDVELVSRLLVLANTFSPDRDCSTVAKMLEARTGNGNSALHLAASVDMNTVEHKKLIQQLMSKGADPSSKNSDGFLPRELTKNRAIVELLKGRTASGRSPNADKKRTS